MTARAVYYNENDGAAAEWLRNLMSRGLIPRGDIDDRSIAEVEGSDLRGYRHVHLFAGIGGWSYAAMLANWPDDRELWTGSCPCQPFSPAGQRQGFRDRRDLWPHMARLAAECRPTCIVGEQASSALGYVWFDRVADDLERAGYTCRAADIPAIAIGAPHRRQRIWWVALPNEQRRRVCLADSASLRSNLKIREAEGGIATSGYSSADDAHSNPWAGSPEILCADGKTRRYKPGLCWLVNGLPRGMVDMRPADEPHGNTTHEVKRSALWRGFGAAVVPQVAAVILASVLEVEQG